MRELLAVARFGGRIYWRDKITFSTSVALALGLGIGLPLVASKVGDAASVQPLHLGLLGMLMTLTGMNQAAVTLSARRDQLILKRMRATGLSDGSILGGEVLNITAQSTLLAVTITLTLFLTGAIPAPGNPAMFVLFVVAGSAVLALLGVAYTAAISRAEIAAVMTMPFFLLAGVGSGGFGPLGEMLPGWAQTALGLLPSSAMVDALAGTGYAPAALNLTVWAVVALVAIRLWFRWEPRRS